MRSPKLKLIGVALGAVFFALSLQADAQQPEKIARIGYLFASTPAATERNIEAFRQGMRELGHVEGKSFILEVRYGGGRAERFPEIAQELVALKLDIIVAASDVATVALKRETQTIPIVMATSNDPVGSGLVASLARPGGNVTGLSTLAPEISGKQLEL